MKTQGITACLWYDNQAEEAANFYISTFSQEEGSPDISKITNIARNPEGSPAGPPGSVLTVGFNLEGQQFLGLNGGPTFTFNPSISFIINCGSKGKIDRLWAKLSEGGKTLMPLDKYPFSKRYGWVQDKFGLSWQLILSSPEGNWRPGIVPSLTFTREVCGKAEDAMKFYISVFDESKAGNIFRYGAGQEPDVEGTVMFEDFMLEGQWFAAMDSAREHDFAFNEAVSFVINCETQKAVDYHWEKLTEGGKESQCGWLKDKYGVSWQVVPVALPRLLQDKDPDKAKRKMQAMLKMKKLDIEVLEQA